jgi:hypothetical protein
MLVLTAAVVLAIEETKRAFSYDDYAAVLKDHVDDAGMVNYRQLKAKSDRLDVFIAAIGKLDTKSYEKWDNNEKIAFWLNAYNVCTLKVIIDNYPIKSSFFRSRIYPKNSIRQIPGVWSKIQFNIMGRGLTLGHIEHKILREKFNEPRIHMAMVCAAMGCPPLRNEPYIGAILDEQLDNQTQRFLANSANLGIDRGRDTLHFSPIFKWFGDDFIKKYGSEKNIGRHDKEESSVLNFIASYSSEADKNYVLAGKFKIKYLKYDWFLNEQRTKK